MTEMTVPQLINLENPLSQTLSILNTFQGWNGRHVPTMCQFVLKPNIEAILL